MPTQDAFSRRPASALALFGSLCVLVLAPCAPAAADETDPVLLEAGITHDDNVSRARAGPDKRGDTVYHVNISKVFALIPVSDQSRVVLTGALAGEKFQRSKGLSHVGLSADAKFQYRASSDFNEPTWTTFVRWTAQAYESSLRDGNDVSVGFSVQQPLTDRIGIYGALAHNRRNADSDVFDTRDNSLRLSIDYALSDTSSLYLGGELRRGDIVSSGRASLENVSIAKVYAQDQAYATGGSPFYSYRLAGRTAIATIGYNVSLGDKSTLDLSWRMVRATPDARPSYATSARNYKVNQVSAVYLLRF